VIRSQEGLAGGEAESTPAGRFLTYFARVATVGSVIPPDPLLDDDAAIKARAEAALVPIAQGAPALILGRAAAVVLARRPRAYHVRLDGPIERRIDVASKLEGLDKTATRRHQEEADRARTLFVKRLYRTDPASASLYHLILDTTVLGVDGSVEVLAAAARAFLSGPSGSTKMSGPAGSPSSTISPDATASPEAGA
jgi:cytidylate kinase